MLITRGTILIVSIFFATGLLPGPSPVLAQPGEAVAPKLSEEQFDKLRELIRPMPGGFDDVPWMTDLLQARKRAAAEGKPILIWVGDGHPLGWT
jgi:hypothetical protein